MIQDSGSPASLVRETSQYGRFGTLQPKVRKAPKGHSEYLFAQHRHTPFPTTTQYLDIKNTDKHLFCHKISVGGDPGSSAVAFRLSLRVSQEVAVQPSVELRSPESSRGVGRSTFQPLMWLCTLGGVVSTWTPPNTAGVFMACSCFPLRGAQQTVYEASW